ncbi:TetR/AcrR family transcriptional regulator [uncultured Roseibium sp.]|uniref:TetR/AcrR family transcriptional regulator n=1 Tax=uncultured Roseibium sp. TaxID=1936171 RepID=UPI003446D896
MPRPKSHLRNTLVENAMRQFWVYGYEATSMDDLVRATGVGRGAIYSDFGGKKDLFLACLSHFQDASVTPALAIVEAEGSGIEAIATYLKGGVVRIKEIGFPGRGCLMGNTLTELGPHDDEIAKVVRAHYDRLTDGFARALANEIDVPPTQMEIRELAGFLAVSVQGLWAYARGADKTGNLARKAETLIELVELKLAAMSCKAEPK